MCPYINQYIRKLSFLKIDYVRYIFVVRNCQKASIIKTDLNFTKKITKKKVFCCTFNDFFEKFGYFSKYIYYFI